MNNERRTVQIGLSLTPEEMKHLRERMELSGFSNRSEFIRQMIFDGYCVSEGALHYIMHEFWYCNDRLEIYSNVAEKKGSVYCSDIHTLREYLEEIRQSLQSLCKKQPMIPDPIHLGLYDW